MVVLSSTWFSLLIKRTRNQRKTFFLFLFFYLKKKPNENCQYRKKTKTKCDSSTAIPRVGAQFLKLSRG